MWQITCGPTYNMTFSRLLSHPCSSVPSFLGRRHQPWPARTVHCPHQSRRILFIWLPILLYPLKIIHPLYLNHVLPSWRQHRLFHPPLVSPLTVNPMALLLQLIRVCSLTRSHLGKNQLAPNHSQGESAALFSGYLSF